jgi:cytochrome c peroxidase
VLLGAFRTPSLRNLEGTEPYMHKGQIATLAEVLEHYNLAPNAMIGHNEAVPLGFRAGELRELEDFLRTLAAPPAAAARWLQPPAEGPAAAPAPPSG